MFRNRKYDISSLTNKERDILVYNITHSVPVDPSEKLLLSRTARSVRVGKSLRLKRSTLRHA